MMQRCFVPPVKPWSMAAIWSACLFFSHSASFAERVTGGDIHPERELMITSPAIVDSAAAQYPGAWSLGRLIEELTGPDKAAACVHAWLETWNAKQTINEQETLPRYGIYEKVIQPWQQRDGWKPGDPARPWVPQLAHAPFRLLAVVNRMDLCAPAVAGSALEVQQRWRAHGREEDFLRLLAHGSGAATTATMGTSPSAAPMGGGYGVVALPLASGQRTDSAGEGRLIFGAIDASGAPLAGGWTVILEYKLAAATGSSGVREWAQAWHRLGGMELTSPAYATALEELTSSFTHGKSAHLERLRSSEAAFGVGREFRQFSFSGDKFTPGALTLTPGAAFAKQHSPEQRALSEFLHVQDPLLRSGLHQLPDRLSVRRAGVALLGGSAIIPPGETNFYWNMTQRVSRDARHLFSLNTCNGCHGGETACASGLHVQPRAEGAAAILSNFLRPDAQPLRVDDPDVKGSKIVYQEMGDRAEILAALLEPRDRATINALRPILRDRLERTH